MLDDLISLLDALSGLGSMMSTTIARYEDGDLFVSTIQASDTDKYETAIAHEVYLPRTTVVEEYEELDDALAGHQRWIDFLKETPEKSADLVDVGTNPIASISRSIIGQLDDDDFDDDFEDWND